MYDKELREISKRWLVAAIRLRGGISDRALAEKADLSHTLVGNIKNGRTVPRDEVINALAAALEVEPPNLLTLLRELGHPVPEYDRGYEDAWQEMANLLERMKKRPFENAVALAAAAAKPSPSVPKESTTKKINRASEVAAEAVKRRTKPKHGKGK